MRVRVVLPPVLPAGSGEPYPVLYFLHPWGLDPTYITDKLNIHQHLWAGIHEGFLPPMVIVLPAGGKSFFINAADPPGHDWSAVIKGNDRFFQDALKQYGPYEDYVLRDVIPYVEERYPVRLDRGGRAIGGLSMGGAGAAVLGFRRPELFCAVGIHSPALFDGPPAGNGPPWIFGLSRESFADRNPADLVQELTPGVAPRVFLDTGDRDMMRAQVAHLHRQLEENQIAHQYSVVSGGHDKMYWEPRMREYLAFYARGWGRPTQ